MPVTFKLFKILSGHCFYIEWYCDLTFDIVTSIFAGFIYWSCPIFLLSTMTVTQKPIKILSGQGFRIKWFCDLDPWPSDLQICRGHLLTMTNLPITWLSLINVSRYWADMMWLMDGQTDWQTDGRKDRRTDGRHTIIRPKFPFGRIIILVQFGSQYNENFLYKLQEWTKWQDEYNVFN